MESETNNMDMFIGEYIRNAYGCLRKELEISRYNKVFTIFFLFIFYTEKDVMPHIQGQWVINGTVRKRK